MSDTSQEVDPLRVLRVWTVEELRAAQDSDPLWGMIKGHLREGTQISSKDKKKIPGALDMWQ